ncbi:putative lipoprotein with Yx(FWY)xxD motif [Sinorhizobium kostiense]|uniref:Lipoprotein with Yx(FWY)xxD motif n=1 Tax=Sinorhizobium kostiense TaxID=76747 RepID=A0ABS4QTL6_9HYPH|nr:hypothetical protein [Sinorhizobium kostiense]MBP2233991.1 putative lipoprotein with Yx(FWY)xxD motif [Sinorhizobium kostiense]
MKRKILFLTGTGLLFVAAASVGAQQTSEVKLTVANSPEHGDYVADAEGRALYMFEADQRGKGEEKASSTCYDACAEAWPPLIAEGKPTGGESLTPDLIDMSERRGGQMQVSYGGWPLYYYVKDGGAGKTTGHDVEDFGGEWYLVAPSGDVVGHHTPGE